MPAYMTAKAADMALSNKTQRLNRTTLPRLPPAPGFDGFEDYEEQVKIWKDWIQWEKEDPLILQEEDPKALKERILYVYKQAVMSLRFEPQMWVEAADFCFANEFEEEGDDFLKQGIEANPESCLLAFKQADRIETSTADETDAKKRGETVRVPYNKVLDALYDLIKKVNARRDKEVARVEKRFAEAKDVQEEQHDDDDDEFMDDSAAKAKHAAEQEQAAIKAVQDSNNAQVMTLRKTLTAAWIALLRAMRRVQGCGKGKADDAIPGSRGIMSQARKRGQLTSDIYIAQALIEHRCYRNASAAKLFGVASGLYPDDENLALEFIKHLIEIDDMTSKFRHKTRFSTVTNDLRQMPGLPLRRPLAN
jgi:cleavage stimulation factor subunit 3